MATVYQSLSAYQRTIEALISKGEFQTVLVDLALRAEAIKNDSLALSRIYGSPTLDRLCSSLGLTVAGSLGLNQPTGNSPTHEAIYVCTETQGIGGHTRVIADLIRATPGRTHHVVLTNLWERPKLYTDEFESLGARVTVLTKGSALEKLRQLLVLLAASPGARVLLFNHHQDSVAVAAVGGLGHRERFFIHHCDYQFCLGTYLPSTTHVDLHTMGFNRCRRQLELNDNIYWPLTCDDSPIRHAGSFLAGGTLTTCCCGTGNKFIGKYPIDYFDTVAERLRAVPGRHVHIGPIDASHGQRLAARLTQYGIQLDRFVYLASVPTLRQALLDHRVDAYLVSFPMGGGRALIEAMSAGIPVIGHIHHRDKMLSGTDLLPEEAPVWTDVQELLAILQGLTVDRLTGLSVAARQRYETYHHPRLLAACLSEGQRLEPPPERVPEVEPLQAFWFERAFIDAQATPRPPNVTNPGRLRFV